MIGAIVVIQEEVIQVVHVMGQGDQMITIVLQRKTLNQKWHAF